MMKMSVCLADFAFIVQDLGVNYLFFLCSGLKVGDFFHHALITLFASK